MTGSRARLWQVLDIVQKENAYLQDVAQRLFGPQATLTPAWLEALLAAPEGIDRLESFLGKFSRMQDTMMDRLLPIFLMATREKSGTALDNLNRAQRLGFVKDPNQWLAMRRLRNRLVREYVDDPAELVAALEMARALPGELQETYCEIKGYMQDKLPRTNGGQV